MQSDANIKELAVAAWRLEKWLDNLNADRKMAAKSALRSIKKYIAASGVEVKDPIGSRFDPGLAVEVVNNEEDASEENLIIIETLAPYVYQNGELIQHAKVIIGTVLKEVKANNGTVENTNLAVSRKATTGPEDTVDETNLLPESETDKEPIKPSTTAEDNDIKINKGEIERMMEYAKIL